MLGFVITLASYYVFVSIFSDGVESQARWKIFTVALLTAILLGGISHSYPTWLGFLAACAAVAVVSLVGLTLWIRTTTAQALKITGSYLGFVVGYSLVIGFIFGMFGVRAA
jgi:hypothetical protein